MRNGSGPLVPPRTAGPVFWVWQELGRLALSALRLRNPRDVLVRPFRLVRMLWMSGVVVQNALDALWLQETLDVPGAPLLRSRGSGDFQG